ncbi:MAG: CHAT domain-containing protein, partial [Chitinophagaceae bacterium]|nr:CHAT domain-containing protein [Chitinophagaceae bacterium]
FNTFIQKGSSQERTVKKLYRAVSIGKKAETQSDSLYYVLWNPLEKAIGNATTIYFSGDGIINNLNLAAIIQPNGKRLCEKYELVQMASTRNILNPALQPNFSKVAVFGGVDYNKPDVSGITGDFGFLQGTLDEAEQITEQFKLAGKLVQLFKGNAASETAIKQNSTAFNVLHIATHGFFIDNNSKVKNAFSASNNPMLRSGLALANANKAWHGVVSKTGEDGILTAYEIAAQDFSNTQLVVLSACETGLGEIKSGEGVYGLQRAFKMAGVNYLIMSLWQVPDLETKEFMKLFYSYCTQGKPIRTAFRLTQLEMNKKYEPYQWAAFVLLE